MTGVKIVRGEIVREDGKGKGYTVLRIYYGAQGREC